MLDIKRIRTDYEEVKKLVEMRGKGDFGLSEILTIDEKKRELLQKVEGMKSEQNSVSKHMPAMKKSGQDTTEIMAKMRKLSDDIKELDKEVTGLEDQIKNILLGVPNALHPSTPIGNDDTENELYRVNGEPTKFEYEPKAHWDIGVDLDILDFERATKIAGTRFTVYKKLGARLERALYNFMLDLHTEEHGYVEIIPPYMVNRTSMIGTGQLPKFEDDMFHLPAKDFFLIPTAEVPVTNLYMNEIIDEKNLPIYHTAFTPCFRKEAGSAGRDTRGLIRQHQFNKVELVKFVNPDTSYDELESLLLAAEEVLKRLEIPYRVVRLCSGDVGFSSAMTYDIEVWMPSYNRYVEISSCSNFEDYQSRRANIKFRDPNTKKPRFVHTLNGSALAVGRTVAAVLENYQQADGSVKIPKVLVGYMGGKEFIVK